MTDRTEFSDEEWRSIAEAPLQITIAIVAVGPHNPITMVKEATASARQLAKAPTSGPGSELIAEIAKDASSHEARHDVEVHRGQSPQEIADGAVAAVGRAVTALARIATDESAAVRAWLLETATAVAGASKSVTEPEQAVLDRITPLLQAPPAT